MYTLFTGIALAFTFAAKTVNSNSVRSTKIVLDERSNIFQRPNLQLHSAKNNMKQMKLMNRNPKDNIIPEMKVTVPLKVYMNKFKEIGYYAPMSFGTPPIVRDLIFDTGSDMLWIEGSPCDVGQRYTTYCYAPEDSKTHKSTIYSGSFEYLEDKVTGKVFKDTVSLQGLPVKEQLFFVAERIGASFVDVPYQGVIGMSPYSFEGPPYMRTLIESLAYEGVISQPIFGFFFARERYGEMGSQLTIGGFDHEISRIPTYYPQIGKEHWKIEMSHVSIKGGISIPTKYAIIDSGSPIILAPIMEADALISAIPQATRVAEKNKIRPRYPCNNPPIVRFTFMGTSYTMSPLDFMNRMDKDTKFCIGTIVGMVLESFPDTWILGVPFLKNVYSVFDVAQFRVGFTSLTNPSGDRSFPESASSSGSSCEGNPGNSCSIQRRRTGL